MFLLFDIGGTKTRLAVSKDGKSFAEPFIFDTPQDFDKAVSLIAAKANELGAGEKFSAIAGGMPGPLDKERTKIINAPNLPGWNNKPFKAELEKVLYAPVFIENDCALAGLGEAVYGAGKSYKVLAYIAVGTGVGGARIVDKKIDENIFGFEPGHQIIFSNEAGGADLEWYVGGLSMEKRMSQKPREIISDEVWEEAAKKLAVGLNNTIVHWSPEAVVLGGSMMKQPGINIERVKEHLKNILRIFPIQPVIEKATLGDTGGLYGALVFLNQKLAK